MNKALGKHPTTIVLDNQELILESLEMFGLTPIVANDSPDTTGEDIIMLLKNTAARVRNNNEN